MRTRFLIGLVVFVLIKNQFQSMITGFEGKSTQVFNGDGLSWRPDDCVSQVANTGQGLI